MAKCKFYSESANSCLFDGPAQECPYQNDFSKCECFELGERIECGSSELYDESKNGILTGKIQLPKYSARIKIGSWEINLMDKTFTDEQIKNMKEMLGWEVENF